MSLAVTRIGPAELADYKAIRLEALRLEPAAFVSSYDEWAAFSDQDWLDRLDNCAVYLAYDGDAPVGVMGLLCDHDPRAAHRGTLIMVYLRAPYRGQGGAEALLEATLTDARAAGVTQVELVLSSENPRAERFYTRLGFTRYGLLPGAVIHEGREIADVLMMRRI
ncbi:GNAT family N-acetyltransferase [Thioclava sp. BHET1]|nr:GNAT family N-acetyltransferase [Thioclava sp. BHET1]